MLIWLYTPCNIHAYPKDGGGIDSSETMVSIRNNLPEEPRLNLHRRQGPKIRNRCLILGLFNDDSLLQCLCTIEW
jgi:hypothetical protein